MYTRLCYVQYFQIHYTKIEIGEQEGILGKTLYPLKTVDFKIHTDLQISKQEKDWV